MAASIFTLLDDVAALLDDVSVAAKVATEKTAGILGDDLAVNAEKATGFLASRELPVIWKITKGSLLNKAIIIPVIFLLQWLIPIAITVILLIGGFYLAYEGMEKIIHSLTHFSRKKDQPVQETKKRMTIDEQLAQEGDKVKSAITTDFILSIEIVIIALSTVMGQPLQVQIITVVIVSILATLGVYGIVALIVRMDDAGYRILRRTGNTGFGAKFGKMLVNALPYVVKGLTIIGTVALLMVSGGIFVHNIHYFHDLFPNMPSLVKEILIAMVAGLLVYIIISIIQKLIPKKAKA